MVSSSFLFSVSFVFLHLYFTENLSEVEMFARKSPRVLLRNFENCLSSSKGQSENKTASGNGEGEGLGFAGVHELEQDGD